MLGMATRTTQQVSNIIIYPVASMRTPMLVAHFEPMRTPRTRSPLAYNAAKLAKGFESLKGKRITDILPVGSILVSSASAPGVGRKS